MRISVGVSDVAGGVAVDAASPGRVLMIGDEPQTCALLTEWLTTFGCELEVVHRDEIAPAVTRDGAFYLVVVGDVTSGLSAAEIVRAIREADSRIPIMLISSGSCEVGFRAARAGADLVLAAP